MALGRTYSLEVGYDYLHNITSSADHQSTKRIYRAVSVNAGLKKGDSAFITGIGGGVALLAMQICVAKGVNVYVSSSSDEKIQKAIEIGAKGGVNYKSGKL